MSFKKDFFLLFARLFVGVIFAFSGFLKLIEPVENFRAMIHAYGVVPYAWVGVIALIVPWFEFIPGICLILGYFPRVAAVALGGLALSFVSLIGLSWLHGTLPENCGCFGDAIHIRPYQIVILDTLNIVLAAKLFLTKSHRWCLTA